MASLAVRDMENHDTKMIRQLILGNFSTFPMVTLTEKRVKLSIAHWLPLEDESSDHTQREQEGAEARAALQVDGEEVRVEFTLPEHITGMRQLLSMLSNYVRNANAPLSPRRRSQNVR